MHDMTVENNESWMNISATFGLKSWPSVLYAAGRSVELRVISDRMAAEHHLISFA